MLKGGEVYLFLTKKFNFLILVCFDLISSESNIQVIDDLVRQIGARAGPHQSILLHAVINIQYNPKPWDQKFVEAAAKFLRPPQQINMANGLVIFSNVASSRECIHGSHGQTGLLFQSNRWQYPQEESALYFTSKPRSDLQGFLFRRKIGGVFSFIYLLPEVNAMQSSDPRVPIDSGQFCRRDPSSGSWIAEVTESLPLKFADYLCEADDVQPCSETFTERLRCDDSALNRRLKEAYSGIRLSLLGLDAKRARDVVRLLFINDVRGVRSNSSDAWVQAKDGEAVRELARSLSICSLNHPLQLQSTLACTAEDHSRLYAVIDGDNNTGINHAKFLYRRYLEGLPYPMPGKDKVILVANRFHGEATAEDRLPDFFNQPQSALSEGRNVTQPVPLQVFPVPAPALHRAQNCRSIEEALNHVRSHIDK